MRKVGKRLFVIFCFISVALLVLNAFADSDWTCSNCGRENDGEIVFCPKCGKLRQDKVQCPSCNKIYSIYDEYGFCPSCGGKLPEVVIEGTDKAIALINNGKYAEADEYLIGLEVTEEVNILRKEAFYESRILQCAYRTKDNLIYPETMKLLEAVCYYGGQAEYDADDQTPMIYYNQPTVLIHYQAQNRGGTNTDSYQRYTWNRESEEYVQHNSVDTLTKDETEPYWLEYSSADEKKEYYEGQMEIAKINLDISLNNLIGGWEMSCDDSQLDRLNMILQKVKAQNISIPQNSEFVPDPIVNDEALSERNRITSIYEEAKALEEQGLFAEAIEKYEGITDYQDSLERIDICKEGIKGQVYQEAKALEEQGLFAEAIEKYEGITDYQDSLERIDICKEGIKGQIYQEASVLEGKGDQEGAYKLFVSLGDYKDSYDRANKPYYDLGIEKQMSKEWDAAVEAFSVAGDYDDAKEQISETRYLEAKAKRDAHDWDGAVKMFEELGDYSDAKTQILETKYQQADALETEGYRFSALQIFDSLAVEDYKDSNERILKIYYDIGSEKQEAEEWDAAVKAFQKAGNYSDAQEQIKIVKYAQASALEAEGDQEGAYKIFISLGDYSDSYDRANKPYYDIGIMKQNAQEWDAAILAFERVGDYSDAEMQIKETNYLHAESLYDNGDFDSAAQYFSDLIDYKDSSEKAAECVYQKGLLLEGEKNYDKAIELYSSIDTYRDSITRIKECKYQMGITLFNKNDYEAAIECFGEIGAYEDAEEWKSKAVTLKTKKDLRTIGSRIPFGIYDGNSLIWAVANVSDGQSLLVCTTAIKNMPFDERGRNVNWKDCSLRKWLNNDFIKDGFSEKEAKAIVLSTVSLGKNGTSKDKVFIPGYEEKYVNFCDDLYDYWIRDVPYKAGKYAMVVTWYGTLTTNKNTSSIYYDVIPMMWVKTDAEIFN